MLYQHRYFFCSLTLIPIVKMVDHRDLINAWRRASYRTNKSDCLKKHQEDGHNVHRRSLCDITNVKQPSYVIPGILLVLSQCCALYVRIT